MSVHISGPDLIPNYLFRSLLKHAPNSTPAP